VIVHDEENLEVMVGGGSRIEALNKIFYNRFQFPPPPLQLQFCSDPLFETQFLNQNLGDLSHRRIPTRPRILVAGCGSYQAISVALQFPGARVVGADVAAESLATCQRVADQIGLDALELSEESLLDERHTEEFDYIICTGVLHHLEDPEAGLRALARALKPSGVLELMVYNRFHRIITAAYQKAIRLILKTEPAEDFDTALSLSRKLITECPMQGQFARYVKDMASEALLADTLLQPIEHSYTVDSLQAMAERCFLELLRPHVSLWDRTLGSHLWSLPCHDPGLRERFATLSDVERWKIANWLLLERSPLLWFYLQRQDSRIPRQSEREVAEELLATAFRRARTSRRHYRQQPDGSYVLSPSAVEHPGIPAGPEKEKILAAVDGVAPLAEVLRRCGIGDDPETVERLRVELTTSTFPYLVTAKHAF
jgi:SAM-dependent methyltransferase